MGLRRAVLGRLSPWEGGRDGRRGLHVRLGLGRLRDWSGRRDRRLLWLRHLCLLAGDALLVVGKRLDFDGVRSLERVELLSLGGAVAASGLWVKRGRGDLALERV